MVRKALFWSYSGQIATFIISFFGSILIARLLSPREMGVYGLAQAVIGIVQLFVAFGIGVYLLREATLTDEAIETAFTVNAVLMIGVSATLVLLSSVGAQFLGEPSVAAVIQLLAIVPLLNVVNFLPATLLQREMAFRGVSILGATAAAATVGATALSAWLGLSYLSPACGALAGGLLSTVGTVWIGWKHNRYRLSIKGWRTMTAFGLRLMSIGGVSVAATRVAELLIGRLLGLEALGMYNRASSLNGLIFTNIYGSATRIVFIQLSEAQNDTSKISVVFRQGFRIITALLGPILIGLAVLSGPVVNTLYGQRWLEAAPLLSLLLIAQFVTLAFSMNWELFVVRNELSLQTRLETFRSVFGLTTTAIGSVYSLIAVAWSSILDALVSAWLYSRHMPRLTGTTPRAIFALYGEAMMLAGVAAAPAVVAMTLYGWSPSAPLPALMLAVALGISAWGGLLVYLDHPLAEEIRRILPVRR